MVVGEFVYLSIIKNFYKCWKHTWEDDVAAQPHKPARADKSYQASSETAFKFSTLPKTLKVQKPTPDSPTFC